MFSTATQLLHRGLNEETLKQGPTYGIKMALLQLFLITEHDA